MIQSFQNHNNDEASDWFKGVAVWHEPLWKVTVVSLADWRVSSRPTDRTALLSMLADCGRKERHADAGYTFPTAFWQRCLCVGGPRPSSPTAYGLTDSLTLSLVSLCVGVCAPAMLGSCQRLMQGWWDLEGLPVVSLRVLVSAKSIACSWLGIFIPINTILLINYRGI